LLEHLRGWDRSRLSHAGLVFGAMPLFGAIAMQAKEIAAGRKPLNLDPTESHGARRVRRCLFGSCARRFNEPSSTSSR
jgi:hypothetical protein